MDWTLSVWYFCIFAGIALPIEALSVQDVNGEANEMWNEQNMWWREMAKLIYIFTMWIYFINKNVNFKDKLSQSVIHYMYMYMTW